MDSRPSQYVTSAFLNKHKPVVFSTCITFNLSRNFGGESWSGSGDGGGLAVFLRLLMTSRVLGAKNPVHCYSNSALTSCTGFM